MKVEVVPARPTAVIAETTTWPEFPQLWRGLLDEVWSTVRRHGLAAGRNVMLYKDDVPNVEIGVEVPSPFDGIGRVVCSSLPAGRMVTTTHRDGYATLGAAHRAVIDECERLGLERLGPRWEIYGHVDESAPDAPVEVEISYLVR